MVISGLREFALNYIMMFMGVAYRWGGDDPTSFDCSGLCVEYLKSTGIITRGSDYTAHGLYNLFKHNEVEKPYRGILIFWGDPNKKIHHVEIAISDELAIGASGGGSRTRTLNDAIRQNAFVKQRHIYKDRKAPSCFVDPFK